MFAQKMNFSNYAGKDTPDLHSAISTIQDRSQDTNTVYSISQHYHHSAHLVSAVNDISPSDTISDSVTPERPSIVDILTQNGVPPSSLLRSQLALFEQSNHEQQSRLLELWRLAPPNYTVNGGQDLADRLGEYQVMTLEQEEELAVLRYERNTQRKEYLNNDMDMDQVSVCKSLSIGEV